MSTHQKSAAYDLKALGRLISKRRAEMGLRHQLDLAKLVGVKQQTVSRWEAGRSRPRSSQISELASVLEIDAEGLLKLAGYGVQKAVVSYDAPFPLDALSPESFERFSADLIQAIYPDAKVSRAGGPGHTQDGLDIVAKLADGVRHTYQCKRVKAFGPKDIEEVVAKHIAAADYKFLLLTRTASPQARAALEQHADWEVWDSDDISRKARQIPLDDLKRLVRTYFAGQEMTLLGTEPSSPWENATEFFEAFEHKQFLFNHTWRLVGRQSLVDEVLDNLNKSDSGVVLLTASGGGGKSRTLKEILRQFENQSPRTKVRIASPTIEITKLSLEQLGSSEHLLIVDDAHDRDDLQVLFNYAAANWPRVKLLMAARSYGIAHIKAQASGYSFSGDRFVHCNLTGLSMAETEELARHVLERVGGPIAAAHDVARLTRDCPLATVVGAQVVAQDNVHPNFALNKDRFRTTLFGRFEDVIAGHLGDLESAEDVRKVMGFVALVQPITFEDKGLLEAFDKVEGVSTSDAQRLLRLLHDAGVLFRRGGKYRLSPDVLGDHLLETRFEGPDRRSNGLAERYFDLVPDAHVENILLNIGRVDWRRFADTADESHLLDGLWAKLDPKEDYLDPHIRAVQAVAYYQPNRALDFVERYIRQRKFLRQLAPIAKYAAYTGDHTRRALECLWALAQQDARDTNPNTDHPLRVLTEFAEPQPNKPLEFNEIVLEFTFNLAERSEAWSEKHTPVDLFRAFLNTEGHTSSSDRIAVHLTPFFVDPDSVVHLRERVIDYLVAALADTDSRKATQCARCLHDALRHPTGLLGATVSSEIREKWTYEFASTLQKICAELEVNEFGSFVLVEIARSVNWQSVYGDEKVAKLAQNILRAIESTDLDYRVEKVLIDGYGMDDRLADSEGHEDRWAHLLSDLVCDLDVAFPDRRKLLKYLENKITCLAKCQPNSSTIEVLSLRLIDDSKGFAKIVATKFLQDSDLKLGRFAGYAIHRLFCSSPSDGDALIASYIETGFASGREELLFAVGTAYQNRRSRDEWAKAEDIANLKRLLISESESVVLVAVRALRSLSMCDSTSALPLVRSTNIPTAAVADEIAAIFEFGDLLPLSRLSKTDIQSLLDRFEHLPELSGHWLDKLIADISELHPWECARFFMQRVEAASANSGHRMRPCNYGPWQHERLRFRKSIEGAEIMRHVALWLQGATDRSGNFHYFGRKLFETMFGPFDGEIVGFLENWLKSTTEDDIGTIASIVREADQEFVFKYPEFVKSLLECAEKYGPEVMQMVSTELYCSAVTGMRHGNPGEPFPEDLALKKGAEKILCSIPRFSAAYQLYDDLKRHAEAQIKRTIWLNEEVEE